MVDPPCGRPAARVADERPDDAALVDAVVLVEALVLGRHERALHEFGKLGQPNPMRRCSRSNISAYGVPPPSITSVAPGSLSCLSLASIGKISDRLVIEIDHFAEVERRGGRRLVLAELLVGGEEVAEIDALEDRRTSLVNACGSSIAVAIKSSTLMSSMSNALRMWAQPARQQLHHLRLISDTIKMGLDRGGRGRDLTERESRGKDLDEEDVHRRPEGTVQTASRPEASSSAPFKRCRGTPGALSV